MSRKFVPFEKVQPNELFEIHDLTWIKCEQEIHDDIMFNAYSLDDAVLDSKNRGSVYVRFFENMTLVQIDESRPRTKQHIEVLSRYDNDN